ncbi:MAG: LptF/LptG family permease [Dysgonamonadaceae bacterium]|jgi:lipopolysaccharide export system permease protein|nr:LptF/LptG family permease [Dysgonamonadaceae bacterium]
MLGLKRLYTFVLQTFLPLLLATFSVCLFVFLMQFLFKYVEDLVGKGVEIKVLAKFFCYAIITLVPMALPLAILLASLMTFGNLGEQLELLAMKASGISLLKIMKPLIILTAFIGIGAFFYQNYAVPTAFTKLFTTLASLRNKSPELDIPEGSFYKEIPNYSIYVKHKEKDGLLRDFMIYDYSKGADNAVVIVADSGRLTASQDKLYLILTMYNGKSFQNYNKGRNQYYGQSKQQVPYLRENFAYRKVLISFDQNFNMQDETFARNRESSKSMKQLRTFIDSTQVRSDSLSLINRPNIINQAYRTAFVQERSFANARVEVDSTFSGDFAEIYDKTSAANKIRIIEAAKSKAAQQRNNMTIGMLDQSQMQLQIRNHKAQMHQRFAISLACILFFFIGAPLGAIIRKGGLGLPAVISVLLFLLYYVVDTFGFKMVKQDILPAWQGMWISSVMLAAMGVFFTWKSVNDSVMLDVDSWKESVLRLFGKREVRYYTKKEVIMTLPDYEKDAAELAEWNVGAAQVLAEKPSFLTLYLSQKFSDRRISDLVSDLNFVIEDLLNSDKNLIIGKLADEPVIEPITTDFSGKPFMRWLNIIVFPLGMFLAATFSIRLRHIREDIGAAVKVNEEIINELKKQDK